MFEIGSIIFAFIVIFFLVTIVVLVVSAVPEGRAYIEYLEKLDKKWLG